MVHYQAAGPQCQVPSVYGSSFAYFAGRRDSTLPTTEFRANGNFEHALLVHLSFLGYGRQLKLANSVLNCLRRGLAVSSQL